jgi:hypothetical protein
MELKNQLHASAILCPGKSTVPVEYAAAQWAPEIALTPRTMK